MTTITKDYGTFTRYDQDTIENHPFKGQRAVCLRNEQGQDFYELRRTTLVADTDPVTYVLAWGADVTHGPEGLVCVATNSLGFEVGDPGGFFPQDCRLVAVDRVPDPSVLIGKVLTADGTFADAPTRVPDSVSDRQFFQQLAIDGEITEDEAVGAVATGTLPQTLVGGIEALPTEQRFAAKMMLKGATTFERRHPMTAVLAQIMGWDDARLDALWTSAAKL